MKAIKILALIAFVALASVQAEAQKSFSKYFNSGRTQVTLDTVTNTGTNYLTVNTDKSAAYTTVQVLVTKQSGAPAGLVKLYGSLDGTNWSLCATTYFYVKNVSAVQDTSWVLTGNPFPWYKVSHTGVGTMASTLQANIYHSK